MLDDGTATANPASAPGGSDGCGHFGYAGLSSKILKPFGKDVFNAYKAPKK